MNEVIARAIDMFGSQAALADKLGISQPAISKLLAGTRRPKAELCMLIEEVTDGRVTVEELRPDARWDVVRSGSGTPGSASAKVSAASELQS